MTAITPHVRKKSQTVGAVLTFRDICERKQSEFELQEAKVDAEAARRADQAKTSFLSNMSHEMRTPIHAMLGFVDIALKRTETASRKKLREYFEHIEQSGRRLLALINDLLDLSKLESGIENVALAPARLREVVASVIDEFSSLLMPRNVSIHLSSGPDIEVSVEREKIMQVIRNLLSNALKFSPKDGLIEINLEQRRDRVQVSVEDRGVGIPPEELRAIFDKFVQSSKTKSGAGGTGLGLAICWEITKLHGGRIWAENREGGGARFVMELPLTKEVLVGP